MPEISTNNAVLMSIHPVYVDKLMSGEKKVEFRKKLPKNQPSTIVVYSTAPVGKVVGILIVDRVETGSPHEIWCKFGNVGGISEVEFMKYYANCDVAHAIVIQRAEPYAEHLDLEVSPPQSFRYWPQRQASLAL